jgi:hypothetical protein
MSHTALRRGLLLRHHCGLAANPAGRVALIERELMSLLADSARSGNELFPAEQARILRLLIEGIDVAPDGISVTVHAAGIRSLVAELADQEAPTLALSEALLEAAE